MKADDVNQDRLAPRDGAELRRISRRRPWWGYRRAHQLLLDEGWELDRKRTQRLWREEGLRVPQGDAKQGAKTAQ
jgi:putative transposase